jgi:surfeit locus 1 family protein
LAQGARPWHWLLAAAAVLAAIMGAWTLWGRMPLATPLPPSPGQLFQLKEVANAADPKSLQHRQVILVGRYTGHTVVLEGRDMAGRSGFYVLSPLVEKGDTGLALLVQQGWVRKREFVKDRRPPRGNVVIEGRLAIPSLGVEAKAAGETGLIRQNLSLQGYASELGIRLVSMVVLQEPGSEWSENDIRQDLFQRRWPELYPRDRNIARNGWAMLALAAALAAIAVRIRPRRRPSVPPATKK